MKSLGLIFIFLLLSIFSILAVFPHQTVAVSQPSQLVPKCNDNNGGCQWNDLVTLANTIVNFLLYLAGSLAAISFAFAGFLYLTAGGNPSKAAEAKGIFWKVIIGLIIAVGAWLLVKAILAGLGVQNTYSLLGS
ncbi:MAG TPA: pilin [Candidatus Paceibacterota bacterium]|nr:pilin [Candidatus Paceibacterota bacterium]